ncbi:MAG: asparaginase [Firmicutes bacterium HGW-Firmicutes-1]|jgi:asparaginyl-tRNA synthetase|nr:MAG: asparaginase [Firmicutes bacterium HGW-Firmicutes-1]
MVIALKEETNLITPKKSWNDLKFHYLSVIEDPWYKSVMDLQHLISYYTYMFYEQRNLKTLHLPITTSSISSPMGLGSDSTPVKVNICDVDTYLADSMQFMLEYGCRIYEEGCFYIMPSFRGEVADERHLCQFYHSEAEIIGGLDDVIALIEDYVKYLCEKLIESYEEKLLKVAGTVEHIREILAVVDGFPRITLQEAIKLLDKKYSNSLKPLYIKHPEGFTILTNYGEKKLIELFGGIVWVTHFEHLSLPFYQAFSDKEQKYALNADLLFGIGEVIGAGERHKDYEKVKKALKIHQVEEQEYEWYCNMKKKYPMQTAGFGMGVERFILWILQHDDIRDCQVLPRFNGINCLP